MQIPVGRFKNFAYIIGDEKSSLAAVVDPHGEIDRLLGILNEKHLTPVYILNTHSHWDHVAGNEELARKTGAKIVAHNNSTKYKDTAVQDGDKVNVGQLQIRVLFTPGHCPDEICLIVENKVLTGDTLFVGECGRTDIPGGDPGQLWDSLFNKLLKLDDAMGVYPGHDYGPTPSSTIGHERKNNYTLKPRTKVEFVRFMLEP